MGYHVEFEGFFECYRREPADVTQLLEVIRGPEWFIPLDCLGPGDWDGLLPLADRLTERGDPRGEEIVRIAPTGDRAKFWRLFGLRQPHRDYLAAFARTRHMDRDPDKAVVLADPLRVAAGLPVGDDGQYVVGDHASDDSIRNHNKPPRGQPGLWCFWRPNTDGTQIEWSGNTKFNAYLEWLDYLIVHFFEPWGYVLHGIVSWQGEDPSDCGDIRLLDSKPC